MTRPRWCLLFSALVGCAPAVGSPDLPVGTRPGATSASSAAASPTPTVAAEAPRTTHVALLEPAELRALEASGFSLAGLTVNAAATSTAELAKLPAWADLLRALALDVKAAARPYPLAKVTSSDGFRLFDARWLESKEMRFSLTGVVNRLDRRVFYPGSCGEVRFSYRLEYSTTQGGEPISSRLPMTLNVVFLVDASGDADCRLAASAWQAPAGPAPVDWLTTSGALSPAAQKRWRLKSIESNLQTFRLQSFVHPTLAGHIEYDLRVFHPTDDSRTSFVPELLKSAEAF